MSAVCDEIVAIVKDQFVPNSEVEPQNIVMSPLMLLLLNHMQANSKQIKPKPRD